MHTGYLGSFQGTSRERLWLWLHAQVIMGCPSARPLQAPLFTLLHKQDDVRTCWPCLLHGSPRECLKLYRGTLNQTLDGRGAPIETIRMEERPEPS